MRPGARWVANWAHGGQRGHGSGACGKTCPKDLRVSQPRAPGRVKVSQSKCLSRGPPWGSTHLAS
eukprot:7299785-Pyramimonas_sp.AAC.1